MGEGLDDVRQTVLDSTQAVVLDLRAQAEPLQAPLRAQGASLAETDVKYAYDRLFTAGPSPTDGYTSR